MLLSYFLSGRLPLVCEQALPELCDARLRLQHHEATTLAVETAEFHAFVLTRLRQHLVDDFHHLLDVLKPGVMQDVDQAERHQRSLADGTGGPNSKNTLTAGTIPRICARTSAASSMVQ